MKLAIILDGMVDHFLTLPAQIPDGAVAVVIDDLTVSVNDIYDASKGGQAAFSENPAAADLAAAATKKSEIKATLDGVDTVAELKAAVAAINNDVNGP